MAHSAPNSSRRAAGPPPRPLRGAGSLYLGDICDNAAGRPELTVYRVLEPDAGSDGELADVEALVLRYPDRPHDAEVLLVDPLDGSIYIITKEITGGPSTVFRTPADAGPDAVLEEVAMVDFRALALSAEPPQDAGLLFLNVCWVPTGGRGAHDRSAVGSGT